jgi:hypothetical protein
MAESRGMRNAQAALYLTTCATFFFGSHIERKWRPGIGALLLILCTLNLIYIFRQKHLKKKDAWHRDSGDSSGLGMRIIGASMKHDVKLNLAILGAGTLVQIVLLIVGCYWFAFRHAYRGYLFPFNLCVLLFGFVFTSFVMLRSGTQKAKFNRSEVKLNGR